MAEDGSIFHWAVNYGQPDTDIMAQRLPLPSLDVPVSLITVHQVPLHSAHVHQCVGALNKIQYKIEGIAMSWSDISSVFSQCIQVCEQLCGGVIQWSDCGLQVACGARHSAAVAAGGQLLCWGWNLHSQCGGDPCSSVMQPRLVPLPPHLHCKQVRRRFHAAPGFHAAFESLPRRPVSICTAAFRF